MGTQQTPGIADLEIWMPPRGERPAALLKWEVKAEGGRLSPEQREYRALCEVSGVQWGVGPFAVFAAFMADYGFLKHENLPHYRRPT